MPRSKQVYTAGIDIMIEDSPTAEFRQVFDSVRSRVRSDLAMRLTDPESPDFDLRIVISSTVKAHVDAVKFEWNTYLDRKYPTY